MRTDRISKCTLNVKASWELREFAVFGFDRNALNAKTAKMAKEIAKKKEDCVPTRLLGSFFYLFAFDPVFV